MAIYRNRSHNISFSTKLKILYNFDYNSYIFRDKNFTSEFIARDAAIISYRESIAVYLNITPTGVVNSVHKLFEKKLT